MRPGAGLAATMAVLVLALALALAGCGSSPAGPDASGSASGDASPRTDGSVAPVSPGSAAGSRVVVTVPGLGSSTGGDGNLRASADPAAPSHGSAGVGTVTVTATASATGDARSTRPARTASAGSSKTEAAGGAEHTTAHPSAGVTAVTSPAPGGATTPAVPPTTSASTSPAPAGGSVTVDLSRCPGCTVIATHADVVGTLSAALATTSRGAVLLAVHRDGSLAGVMNVPYGASFPAPERDSLPCDGSGRCIVTAKGSGGNAVLSAFQLTAGGGWRDVSGSDGFPSATPRGAAVDVNGDGSLDIAVQESAGNLTDWMVLSWSGDRFAVLGCAPDSDSVPPASELSRDSCLS